jgi:hypothetical protein
MSCHFKEDEKGDLETACFTAPFIDQIRWKGYGNEIGQAQPLRKYYITTLDVIQRTSLVYTQE